MVHSSVIFGNEYRLIRDLKAPAKNWPLWENDISIRSFGVGPGGCQVDVDTTWLASPMIASHFPSLLNLPTPAKPIFPSNCLAISPEARSQTLAARPVPAGRL